MADIVPTQGLATALIVDQHHVVSGQRLIADSIPRQVFMADYEGMRVEWISGAVIEMAGVDQRHDALSAFLRMLFAAFLEETGGGRVTQDPFLLKMETSTRAPDLQVLLPEHLDRVEGKQVVGVPDLIVEIVSPGSQRADRVEKYSEYETAGVPEYWIIDPAYQEALFMVLGENGLFERQSPELDGVYHSAVLMRFKLKVDVFWQDTLPTVRETLTMVAEMLAES